jgi:hypothetical protein
VKNRRCELLLGVFAVLAGSLAIIGLDRRRARVARIDVRNERV